MLTNVIRNALRPGYLPEMAHKVMLRLLNRVEDGRARALSTAWCAEVVEDESAFAECLDPALWAEARDFAAALAERGDRKLGSLRTVLGGGGHYPLLYFLTRYRKPAVIVETGVSAGFSSSAFLAAIRANRHGHLYSSDFPCFRLDSPEQYIGWLVDEELKPHWTLLLRGDRRNLPAILKAAGRVDLFHYDSDKTYSGRKFALDLIGRRLAPGGLILMDDIQDNLFFRDYVQEHGCSFRVFEFEQKYAGLISL